MSMVPLHELFRDVAERETRSLVLTREQGGVPEAEYAFTEWYCVEPKCDCRRVLLKVLDVGQHREIATINYAFEPPDDPSEEQLFLDPLHRHAPFAPGLLALFEDAVLADAAYVARLERHYAAVKQLAENPHDPRIRRIRDESAQTDGHLEALSEALADGTIHENIARGTFTAEMVTRPWKPRSKAERRARRRG